MKKLFKSQVGFTLIELLIVIAVLGILAVVTIPRIGSFMGTADVASANTEASSVKVAALAYTAEGGSATSITHNDYDEYLNGNPKAWYVIDVSTNDITSVMDTTSGDTWNENIVYDISSRAWRKLASGETPTERFIP